MASVKVAVRVRPFNQRELDMETPLIIQMKGKTTGILNSKANTRDENIRYKEFTFDYSYWSFDGKSSNFASQEMVYNDLGSEVIDCAFHGYNACVFAYGQTGSGKTFTMMGSPDNQGLIPRICKALFEKMSENSKLGITHRVQVSYLEIYQERVADLLGGRDNNSLKVREHPKKGPYVQGLTTRLVTNYNHIQDCMNRGNTQRTTAATNMNDVSSRSHAIFTITFVQAGYCDGMPSETVSKIHLVDLAGSERADATGATGQRLKEGAHINKSLVTLGSVISALAELSVDQTQQRKTHFIPYRDSVLTWLLKDSLGGNSKTIMIAAISPADCNYGETLSTLRYANRAKNIINKPTVNEDPNVKLIRELRDEISKLKSLMFSEHRSDMLATLHEKEAREKELTEEWAGKWREAQAILREQRALGLRKSGPGVVLDSDRPHLVAIDDDPLSTGVTLYHLKEGQTSIGTEDADIKPDIVLKGAGMEPRHCTITFINGSATLIPHPGAHVMLYNTVIESPTKLSQGCIIFLGKTHVFRFNDPAEAAELRRGERTFNLSRLSLLSWSTPDLAVSMENLIDDEKSEIEVQRQHLEKERELLEKEQEAFERKQEAFEQEKKNLALAQSQLKTDNTTKTTSNKVQLEQIDNKQEIDALVQQRDQLEVQRSAILNEINREVSRLVVLRADVERRLLAVCNFIKSESGDIAFPDARTESVFQEIVLKSQSTQLTEADYAFLYSLLGNIKGTTKIQDVISQHKQELALLQEELNSKVSALSERQRVIENLDQKLVELVEQQMQLNSEKKDDHLENLKRILASRTKDELTKIDERKKSLSLNLLKVNAASSDALISSDEKSSDTYHTAPSSCWTPTNPKNFLMSDSGVEMQLSKMHEESDLSSNEEFKASDSRSSSSIENHSPRSHKESLSQDEVLNILSKRIEHQKQLIVKNLDSKFPKSFLDSQIENLQELQRQYMAQQCGSSSVLSPTAEHPLQHLESPSPVKPLSRGSTSALYSPPLQVQGQRLSVSMYNQSIYRSMPSISTDTETDAIVSIVGFCMRGAGSKTHYEYELKICTVDERWTVLRRYSRFRDLHIAMKVRYKDKVASIPFPSKLLFSNTESVALTRKRQLENYLRRLIDICRHHPNCPLAYSGPITKVALISFSPFFKKGVFENGKYGTS